MIEFYVQDNWKVTPRLTVDYGVRLSHIGPFFDSPPEVDHYDPVAGLS